MFFRVYVAYIVYSSNRAFMTSISCFNVLYAMSFSHFIAALIYLLQLIHIYRVFLKSRNLHLSQYLSEIWRYMLQLQAIDASYDPRQMAVLAYNIISHIFKMALGVPERVFSLMRKIILTKVSVQRFANVLKHGMCRINRRYFGEIQGYGGCSIIGININRNMGCVT